MLSPGLTMASGSVSFESYDKPEFYLRHYKAEVDLEDKLNGRNPEIFNEDATFYRQRSRFHEEGSVSFESVNYRGYWLRHQNYRIKIAEFSADDSHFPGDVTYYGMFNTCTIYINY